MTTFLALYRGKTVAEARMVAVTCDPHLVALVATRLLEAPPGDDTADPVVTILDRGRRAALRLMKREAAHLDVSPQKNIVDVSKIRIEPQIGGPGGR